MTKQITNHKVDFLFSWTYGVSIEKIREDLDALEKLGVTSINIEEYEEYGNSGIRIEAYTTRLETDEEYNTRIQYSKDLLEKFQLYELAELKRLQEKYGK